MHAISGAVLLLAGLLGHPDHKEDRLLFHFAVGTHEIRNGAWEDVSHQATAQVLGAPRTGTRGPTECLRFRGTERLNLAGSLTEAQSILPTREFTVAAWVSLDKLRDDGGIVGCFQDNGAAERGWVLGYDRERFTFAVSSVGSDDGDGKLTYLRANQPIRRGAWHYVVATYDGQAMRLYVDGQPAGESQEQSGDILYPQEAEYVIGGYVDRDEEHLLEGGLFEIKAYRRAMSAEEIAKIADKNRNLIAWAPAAGDELQFLVQPYLQFGTTDSMTILCETSRPTKMEVQYAETQPLRLTAATEQPALISELTLRELKPHTRYFYRVVCVDEGGAELQSDIFSFQTAPPADRPWAFAIIGDTQRNPEVTRRCAEGAFALRPNFLLHCGDVVDDGFAKNQWLKDLFEPCSKLMAHVPTFPVIGNHERDSHWYYDYFSMPKPEYWYTFHYGNAQFFMLDTNRPLDPGTEQFQWLERELSQSKAAWKFAAHHHPCFSSDEDDYGDHLQGTTREPFTFGDPNAQHAVPLYEKYGIDIVFNGHIHVYERTWPIREMKIDPKRGVRYITSGGGGGGLETPAPQRTWFSLHVNRAHHFCQVAVHDRTMVFQAYDIEGRMFDAFEFQKPASAEEGTPAVADTAGE